MYRGGSRQGRNMFSPHVQSPDLTREELLNVHKLANEGRIDEITSHIRQKRQGNSAGTSKIQRKYRPKNYVNSIQTSFFFKWLVAIML